MMKLFGKLLCGAAVSVLMPGEAAQAQDMAGDRPISAVQQQVIARQAISLLREHYIFPDRVAGIETRLKTRLRSSYGGPDSLFGFLEILNADLEGSSGDRHLNVFYGPAIVAKLRADAATGGTPDEYLKLLAYENFRLRKAERMDGNIGYIKLNGFIEPEHSRAALQAAMGFVAHSAALILDLRENGGGSAAAANLLVSCFLPDGTLLGEFISRKDGSRKLFSSREPGMPSLNIPLYILVSGRTSSAAEAVAYQLQQLKRATVVGAQTHGEANPGQRFPLNDSLYIMIPTAINRNAVTGTNWERSGVTPDIKTEADLALSAALVEACKRLAPAGKNDIYAWLLPEYEAQLRPEEPAEALTRIMAGAYAGKRQIVRENGTWYYITGTQKRRLSYIGGETFMIEGKREVRLRFPSTPAGSLEFVWNDGSSEFVRRIR